MSRWFRLPGHWLSGGLLVLLPWWGPAGDAYQALEAGNALYLAGQYEAALGEYEIAAAALPDAPEIAINQGNAWFKRFDYGQALEHYHEALDTVDPFVASRLKYNIGVVKYQQAIDAMQTFQDALSETREAIDFFRESLRLDPKLHDARYNLELAYDLLQRIKEQEVQGQRNAETRDQETSENRGQSFPERASEEQSGERDAEAEAEDQRQGREATQAPPGSAQSSTRNQIEQARSPQPMSPEAAEEMLEMLRERSEATKSAREAQQRARIREAGLAKTW
jgi:Ca-activated chloride channel family protein